MKPIISPEDTRSREEIQAHYHIEKQLAKRLREASRDERKQLYTRLYAELFESVPYFSARVSDTQGRLRKVSKQVQFLSRFLSPDKTFMDVGAGDCALAIELCRQVKKVYALDVAHQVNRNRSVPDNLELVISDGTSINVPAESMDIAFSNQLMEHLHPDDARDQLKNIHNSIAAGGWYILITPHRFCGPHDVSRYFDRIATGFHLKEYTLYELRMLLKQAGFSTVCFFAKFRGIYKRLDLISLLVLERMVTPLPHSLRKSVMGIFPFKLLRRIRLAARK
jgi:SAM-dependent methyltransferase